MIKVTKYFLSGHKDSSHLYTAIEEVEKKKMSFISENLNEIGKIEKEEIKFLSTQNNNYVYAVICLTYFPKEK